MSKAGRSNLMKLMANKAGKRAPATAVKPGKSPVALGKRIGPAAPSRVTPTAKVPKVTKRATAPTITPSLKRHGTRLSRLARP